MRFLIVLFAFLASQASAQVVVKTGEHGAFTRLVLQFDGEPAVSFGRTEAGYELSVATGNPAYDLTRAFQLIGRQRLKSIWADPTSGNLLLGVGCACHALMQVASDGLIIIDIHDGAAAPDTGSEVSLAGVAFPPLGKPPTLRPRPRPFEQELRSYQWTSVPQNDTIPDPRVKVEEPLITSLELHDLRQRLAASIDVAGATGIVELRPSGNAASEQTAAHASPGLNMQIGPRPPLSEDGNPCRTEEAVAVPDWRPDGSPAEALARSRNGILKEFDLVDQSQLLTAVRTHIYFGFGAEARNLIENFGLSTESSDLLLAMSQILDGLPLVENPLADQTRCKGALALWSLAALPAEAQATNLDADSVVQAFMALPEHLQMNLASDLTKKLIASNNVKSAEIISATLSRATGSDTNSPAVVEAEIALAKDDLEAAQHSIDTIKAPTNLKALVLKTETAFRKRQPLGAGFLTEIEALYFVEASGPDGPELARAVARVRALEGDFDGALSLAEEDAEATRDIWSLLAEKGGNGTLLNLASQTTAEDRKRVAPSDRGVIFDRLIGLGFPTLAEDWMDPETTPKEAQARLALARHDGRQALTLLETAENPSSSELRLEALTALNRHEDLAHLLTASGQEEQATRVRRWIGAWEEANGAVSDPWSRLAQSATEETSALQAPSLTKSTDLVESTAEDMKDISALLQLTALN